MNRELKSPEEKYIIYGNEWDGYGIKYGDVTIVIKGSIADLELAKELIEKANQIDRVSMKELATQEQLIRVLECQVVDLSMMSKIELGDDVIAEIKRLQEIISNCKEEDIPKMDLPNE